MKYLFHSFLCLIFISTGRSNLYAQSKRPCANPDVYLGTKAADYCAGSKLFEQWISKAQRIESDKAVQDNNELYYIPVVIHVLHNGEAEGIGKNLSQARIQSQIDILNNDYGKVAGTAGFNTHPAGADTRIRFCLATTDPDGQPTNGVVRKNTNREGFEFLSDNTLLKSYSFWDPTKYLNIWTCQINGGQYIGYAQYPIIPSFWADSLPMIQPIPDIQPDGVVIEFRVFGDVPQGESGPFAAYNKGRTTTHEIGHYLGLIHIWGDGVSCTDTATDFCIDTPPQATYTAGCPVNPVGSCTPGIPKMKENYLDYTNDVCMNIFTNEQKKRMRIVLRNCIRRNSLLQTPTSCGIADTQPTIGPPKRIQYRNDPLQERLIIDAPTGETIVSIQIFGYSGQEVAVSVEQDAVQSLLDLRSLAKGIYNLRIKTDKGFVFKSRFARW